MENEIGKSQETGFNSGDKTDNSIINHLRNVKLLQAIHSGKRFYVSCYPTDEGAISFPNSNLAVKEIELPNFDLYEEKLGYKWRKEPTGLKWVKASERLPEIDNNHPKHYVFRNNVNHNAINIWTEFINDWPPLIVNYRLDWEWLDEKAQEEPQGKEAKVNLSTAHELIEKATYWKYLSEAQTEYISFLTKEYNGIETLAYVHGHRHPESIIKRGQELRDKINELQSKISGAEPEKGGESK